jgi:pantetheine-phosphate adenylyltransferase
MMASTTARTVAIYPGTFDPFTNGHLDLVRRGSRLFDRLIVAVAGNQAKQPLFSAEARVEMVSQAVSELPNVDVDCFSGLLVGYAVSRNANVLLRGIRGAADYEYELQMARMNSRLQPDIETVALLSSEAFSFISSRLVKEVAGLGGSITGLVPPSVEARLRDRLNRKEI